ncbi:MAG TPA: hypothetical protein VFP72_13070 [Kineosporiaceae bacterium]|nr:hypothetical protein [Kineosporiaceae bacterium]
MNEATTAWRQLVDQVEGGYGWCVDEYTNDLTARDWLDEAWPVLTSRVRAAREPELAAIDARFRAATTDDDGELLAHFFRVGRRSGWWWRRRPLHLVGQFAEDARRAGVL